MNIVVTNDLILHRLKQKLLIDNDLIVQTNSPTKRLTFAHKDTNEITAVLLLEKWNDKALRGKQIHKVYTTPDFYLKHSDEINQVAFANSLNNKTEVDIVLQVG